MTTVLASAVTRRWLPRVPHLIMAMMLGSVLGMLLNAAFGAAHTGIESIGALPVGWPPLSMPDISVTTVERLIPVAIAVALLSLT